MKVKNIMLTAAVACLLAACQTTPSNQGDEYARDCWNGLTSNASTLDKTYVTAGRKAQIIGQQSLAFKDMGGHIPGEMGGVWMGRIKAADGFWMNVTGADGTMDSIRAQRMTVYPHYNTFDCGSVQGGIDITCEQFVSDTEQAVAVGYTFTNNSGKDQQLNLDFMLNTDLSPAWYSKKDETRDNAEDIVTWDDTTKTFTAKDGGNDWFMAWGGDHDVTRHESGIDGIKTQGPVNCTVMTSVISLKAGESETVHYFIGGSAQSAGQAISHFNAIKANYEQEKQTKKEEIRDLLANSSLNIPDKEIQNAYDWTVINDRWLEMDVEQLGYFLGAGAVEYPWLFGCDMTYALQGVLRIGKFDLAKSTLEQLWKTSDEVNGNGRIIHERSNYGLTYNPGNTNETAHFIMALWDYYLWTGDRQFVEQVYPYAKKGIEWLTVTMDEDGDLFPSGPGIMEVSGLNAELIDVAVYTQQALERMSAMAKLMGEDGLSSEYSQKAVQLKDKINDEFWNAEKVSYCDFHATGNDALKAMDGAIRQYKLQTADPKDDVIAFYNQQKEDIKASGDLDKEKGWFSNLNWVVATPMECGIVDADRAAAALKQIEEHNYGPYGPWLSVAEHDRMMTIATSVQAVAEARYGRIDKAVENLKQMSDCLSMVMPGAIAEMLPDYGCPFQAWTVYGFGKAVVSGLFGIQPDAASKTVTIQPLLPTGWGNMSISNVKMGDNAIDLTVTADAGTIKVSYNIHQPGWKATFVINGETQEVTAQSGVLEF